MRRGPGRGARAGLPAVMSEGLVCLGHLVHVFPLLNRTALVVGGVDYLSGESFHHRLFAAGPGVVHEPPERQRHLPLGPELDRNLICRSADPPGLDFQYGLHILDSLLEHLQGFGLGLFFDKSEGAVKYAFSLALLAVLCKLVYKLHQDLIAELRIRQHISFRNIPLTRHGLSSLKTTQQYYLGLL